MAVFLVANFNSKYAGARRFTNLNKYQQNININCDDLLTVAKEMIIYES